MIRQTKCSKKQITLKHISWLSIPIKKSSTLAQHSNKTGLEEDKQLSILYTNVLALSHRMATGSFGNLNKSVWKDTHLQWQGLHEESQL